MYIHRLRIKTNILNVFIAILNNFISNRRLLIVLLFLKDTRILILWITVYLSLSVSSIQSKSFFIHSSVVNGKKKIVATEVNSTASSFGNTRPKTAAEPKSGKFEIPLSSADQEWLGSLLYHPNESDIRLRKEYRQLSEKERGDLNVAFNLLKNDTVRVIIYIHLHHVPYSINVNVLCKASCYKGGERPFSLKVLSRNIQNGSDGFWLSFKYGSIPHFQNSCSGCG